MWTRKQMERIVCTDGLGFHCDFIKIENENLRHQNALWKSQQFNKHTHIGVFNSPAAVEN